MIVLAASGRWLVEAACAAGFDVWLIEQFADVDALRCCRRHQQVDDFSLTTVKPIIKVWLNNAGRASVIYGGGLEQYPETLDFLARRSEILGNTAECFRKTLAKRDLFAHFARLGIAVPETRFTPPALANDWLYKPMAGQGGSGIRLWQVGDALDTGGYWQRFVPGVAGSVLFAANGRKSVIMAVHRYYQSEPPWRFAGLSNASLLTARQLALLDQALAELVLSLRLKGLNTLDIITDGDTVWALEINARPSASLQLYAPDWLAVHRSAVAGYLPKTDFREWPASGFRIVYARHEIVIAKGWRWPGFCHDCPPEGAVIGAGQPICTVSSGAENHARLSEQLDQAIHFLTTQLKGMS